MSVLDENNLAVLFCQVIVSFVVFKKDISAKNSGLVAVDRGELREYLQRRVVTRMDVKSKLLRHFDALLEVVAERFDQKIDQETIEVTHDQLCTQYRQLVQDTLVDPQEFKQTEELFARLGCSPSPHVNEPLDLLG